MPWLRNPVWIALSALFLATVNGPAAAVGSGKVAPEQAASFDRWALSCSQEGQEAGEHCRIEILFPARANVGILVITATEHGWTLGLVIRPAEEDVFIVNQARLVVDGNEPVDASACAILICLFLADGSRLVEEMRAGRRARLEFNWDEGDPLEISLPLRNLPALLEAFEMRTAATPKP
ncbi:MAG: hypothetical protein K0S81_1609 [Rhodospirillales bacterium]|jgi:hypothetical protein|nr:hypothetical protein [Rhodospirillales bacterium]